MTNELAIRTEQSTNMDEIKRTAMMLAMSGYFDGKGDFNTQVAQIGTRILAGQEMGFGPFASNSGIHIIQGKPTVGANLMAAAVKAHPSYDYRVRKMAADAVEVEFFEDGESIGISEFTAQDAKNAGTQNMQKFGRNMLFARAMSNGVKWFTPDVFYGNAVYTPDELDDSDTYTIVEDEPFTTVNDDGEVAPESLADAPADTAAHLASPDDGNYVTTEPPKPEPPVWKNASDAKKWAVEYGAYDKETVSDAYAELKAKVKPGSAGEMWAQWIEHCMAQIASAA